MSAHGLFLSWQSQMFASIATDRNTSRDAKNVGNVELAPRRAATKYNARFTEMAGPLHGHPAPRGGASRLPLVVVIMLLFVLGSVISEWYMLQGRIRRLEAHYDALEADSVKGGTTARHPDDGTDPHACRTVHAEP